MCTKCNEVKCEWFAKTLHKRPLKPDFKKRFDIVFGKGEHDKVFRDGKPHYGVAQLQCRKCGTAFILREGG